MNLVRLLSFGCLVSLCVGAGSVPAAAGLKLCNQTSYIVYAAIGSATKTELDTRGWTRIVPGDCATPIETPLTAPAYFIYAHTSQAHSGPSRAWGGKIPICARDNNFVQRMKLPVRGCQGSDFYKMPFAVVDRHGLTSWTTTFTESSSIKRPNEAKRAGIDRLLEDLGYHVKVPGERARDLALDDFHKRIKLAADATDADLFNALETEATKLTAPAGYTVCNDTDQPLWAAIAPQTTKGLSARGWWQVSTGACSRLLTDPLKSDRVYLFAQHKNKAVIVSGPLKLCVVDAEFEWPQKKACTGKGLAVRGFAATDTRGHSGYVAHVGDSGLLPPAPPLHKAGASK
jgi:uncharacterized membrane protein